MDAKDLPLCYERFATKLRLIWRSGGVKQSSDIHAAEIAKRSQFREFMIHSTRALPLLLLTAWTVFTQLTFAQTTGVLRGQVLDPSGASVPKAAITVTGANNVVKAALS